jgi:hypothetical protein
MDILGFLNALLGGAGSIIGGSMQANAQNRATASQRESEKERLAWEQRYAQMQADAQDEENLRRTQEAQFRAAKLEDVAGMLQALQGMGDSDRLRSMGSDLLGNQDYGGLERAAMRGLERSSGMLDASLASRGLFSSGYAAQSQRGLAGDVMANLARDIANQRTSNMGMAANMFGQAGSLDMSRIGQLANIFSDDSFGANLPYTPKRQMGR